MPVLSPQIPESSLSVDIWLGVRPKRRRSRLTALVIIQVKVPTYALVGWGSGLCCNNMLRTSCMGSIGKYGVTCCASNHNSSVPRAMAPRLGMSRDTTKVTGPCYQGYDVGVDIILSRLYFQQLQIWFSFGSKDDRCWGEGRRASYKGVGFVRENSQRLGPGRLGRAKPFSQDLPRSL
jgi:hypothetical protein